MSKKSHKEQHPCGKYGMVILSVSRETGNGGPKNTTRHDYFINFFRWRSGMLEAWHGCKVQVNQLSEMTHDAWIIATCLNLCRPSSKAGFARNPVISYLDFLITDNKQLITISRFL
ncbi:hypothetical protein [Desulfonatronum parangueonense]